MAQRRSPAVNRSRAKPESQAGQRPNCLCADSSTEPAGTAAAAAIRSVDMCSRLMLDAAGRALKPSSVRGSV
jgi:hypothetical protein